MGGMEVELDVEEPQENWRLVVADWVACCKETWLCQEMRLFQASRGAGPSASRRAGAQRLCMC